MSDIGIGDVRGSSVAGKLATRNAHAEARRQIGPIARRMVEYLHVLVMSSQRASGRRPVYWSQVACVKRRVKDGSALMRPETIGFFLARFISASRAVAPPSMARIVRTLASAAGRPSYSQHAIAGRHLGLTCRPRCVNGAGSSPNAATGAGSIPNVAKWT